MSTDTNSAKRAARDDSDAPETPGERRMTNLLIIGIILLIFGAAFWLGDALLDARRADECMASGRGSCGPVTVPAPPQR